MIVTLDDPVIVLKKLRAIRAELSRGIYDPVQAVGVGNAVDVFLLLANRKPKRRITRTALYESIGVSKSIISKVASNRHVPRMENFFPIVDGLIENFEGELGLASISLDGLQGLPSHLVVVPPSLKEGLSSLSELLAELISRVQASNSLGPNLLNEFQKQQLIAVLELALSHLKSPIVETNSLGKTVNWLRSLAKKSAEKGTETFIGKLAGSVAIELARFLKGLL